MASGVGGFVNENICIQNCFLILVIPGFLHFQCASLQGDQNSAGSAQMYSYNYEVLKPAKDLEAINYK